MSQKRHAVDQVIAKLRRADVLVGKGTKVTEVCKRLEITETTRECLPMRRSGRWLYKICPIRRDRSEGTSSWESWSMDCMVDKPQLFMGQRFCILTTIDNLSRKSLDIGFRQCLTEDDLVKTSEEIGNLRGASPSI